MARTRTPYVPAAVRRARTQSRCGWAMIVATVIGFAAMCFAATAPTALAVGTCAAITVTAIFAIIVAYCTAIDA